jgi:hypothetical protein
MTSHGEKLDAAAAALRDIAAKKVDRGYLDRAAIALEKAEKRIDALEIMVRALAKGKIRLVDLEAEATRQNWPRSELRDLLE